MPALADLSGLPATTVVNAEYDDLRPSGEAFALQLERSDVDVDMWMEPGTAHGFLTEVGAVHGADRTLNRFAAILRARLGTAGSLS